MRIEQYNIILKPKPQGFHLVTSEIEDSLSGLRTFDRGFAHIFIQHTSAALTINENADPTVRTDFRTFFSRLVPNDISLYEHNSEGADDMTSHIKTSLFGSSVIVPVTNGKFNMGTWQGIYLCEFRNRGGSRRIVVTITGE